MAARHASTAMRMVEKAAEALERVKVDELGVRDLAIFFELGVKIERLSRGEPDTTSDAIVGPQDTIRDFLADHPELAGEFAALAAAAGLAEQAKGASNATPMRRRGPRRRASNE